MAWRASRDPERSSAGIEVAARQGKGGEQSPPFFRSRFPRAFTTIPPPCGIFFVRESENSDSDSTTEPPIHHDTNSWHGQRHGICPYTRLVASRCQRGDGLTGCPCH